MPRIPISISMVDILEALCDFGSSVNIMPRLADRTLSFPKGNIEEPLHPSWYLVRPSTAKISLYNKERKETFSFKNKTTQISE